MDRLAAVVLQGISDCGNSLVQIFESKGTYYPLALAAVLIFIVVGLYFKLNK